MKRIILFLRLFLLLIAFTAFIPLIPFLKDWQMAQQFNIQIAQNAFRGFDWVQWAYQDGQLKAVYVFPGGTASSAGLHQGDVLIEFDYNRFFDEESFKSTIQSVAPNSTHTYTIRRGNREREYSVQFTAYPIFLYPLSTTIWNFTVWGFFMMALIHLIALAIVIPLVRRSPKARDSLALIVASSFAIIGNFLRILMLMTISPSQMFGFMNDVFQALSMVSLLGWIGFPPLLIHKVLSEREALNRMIGHFSWVIFTPTIAYTFLTCYTFFFGTIGPFAFKSLLPPVLFMVFLYIASATGIYLLLPRFMGKPESVIEAPAWNQYGSFLVMILALLTGFSVLLIGNLLPLAPFSDLGSAWVIVCAQILTTAPILLVTQATLKYGKYGEIVSKYVSYSVGLALVFLLFLGIMSFVTTTLDPSTHLVIGGLLCVLFIVAFEEFVRLLRTQLTKMLASQQQRSDVNLRRFGENMMGILDHQTLVEETLREVMQNIPTQNSAIALQLSSISSPASHWLQAHATPDMSLSDENLSYLLAHLKQSSRIWSNDPELNEQPLDRKAQEILKQHGFQMLVPIAGRDALVGFLALSAKINTKKGEKTVFNLAEIEQMRTLCNQLSLANERIALVERERVLVKQHAEAELVALRAQINPHFLFNALNTLAALIDENPQEAEKNVEHLASIFRYTLKTGSKTFMPLADEFSLIKHYLAIEQTRFGPNLVVEISFDPKLSQLPIPAFAVQTLVENAIKHGIEKNKKRGTLRIQASILSQGLTEIQVHDTGAGIPHLFALNTETQGKQSFFGIGLSNVASRLAHLYHRNDLLRYTSNPDTGTTARLLIPQEE